MNDQAIPRKQHAVERSFYYFLNDFKDPKVPRVTQKGTHSTSRNNL